MVTVLRGPPPVESTNQNSPLGWGVPAPRVLGVTALCGWWYLALVWVLGGVEDGAQQNRLSAVVEMY